MRSASPMPVPGSFEAWRMRLVSIMRELADRHEAGMASGPGFAPALDVLAGRGFAARPVLVGAARWRLSGRG